MIYRLCFIIFIIFILFIFSSCSSSLEDREIRNMTIRGPSMYPTLKDGEVVQLDINYYKNHALNRGDIVGVYLKTHKSPFVKRVVGISGDTVEIKNKTMYINGLPEVPYYADQMMTVSESEYRMLLLQLSRYNNTLPERTLLGLGDNRGSSLDSSSMGLFSYSQLYGKVVS